MNTFHKTRALLGALLALLTASTAMAQNQSNVTAACDRACLTRVVDAYVAGLIANDPAKAPFAPGAKLTLNDDVVPAGKLFWDQARLCWSAMWRKAGCWISRRCKSRTRTST